MVALFTLASTNIGNLRNLMTSYLLSYGFANAYALFTWCSFDMLTRSARAPSGFRDLRPFWKGQQQQREMSLPGETEAEIGGVILGCAPVHTAWAAWKGRQAMHQASG